MVPQLVVTCSAPARILPASGPNSTGSLGSVVTPSKCVPIVATNTAVPAELIRQTSPTSSLATVPFCSLPVTMIKSPLAAEAVLADAASDQCGFGYRHPWILHSCTVRGDA